jgi:hypothetical protein
MALGAMNVSAREAPHVACGSPLHEELSRKSDLYTGMYSPQLELWFEHFSRSQVLVVAMDELIKDTTVVISRLTRYLRFEATLEYVELPRANVNSNSTPPISCSTRDALAIVYGPWNSRLYSVLELAGLFGNRRPQEEVAFTPFSEIPCE